jgi:hypothetical protein
VSMEFVNEEARLFELIQSLATENDSSSLAQMNNVTSLMQLFEHLISLGK